MRVPGRIAPWLLALLLAAGCTIAAPGSGGSVAPAVHEGPTPPTAMADITRADLPPEAIETLGLIAAGGPFPYEQDGVVFQNREGLLPQRPRGYYHEYTVVTPGSADRGARRIIAGADGDLYWTADHYDSFAWILP